MTFFSNFFPQSKVQEITEDLNDASKQLEELVVIGNHYETVRKMNPRQFKEAWDLNVSTGKPFDEIVDEIRLSSQVA